MSDDRILDYNRMRTLVLFKPDCVSRGLVGECLARFERKGIRIAHMRVLNASIEVLEDHYVEHSHQPYYDNLIKTMQTGPLILCILERTPDSDIDLVAEVRSIVGPYSKPMAGTIRGDLAVSKMENLVHSSDSAASAEREIRVWCKHDPNYYRYTLYDR